MPKALDPEATFDVVLESDRDKPAAERPTFVYRQLTGRQWHALATMNDSVTEEMTGPEAINLLYIAAATNLVGWRNMIDPKTKELIAFAPGELDRVVAPFEVEELLVRLLESGTPSSGEENGSESPSSSGTGSCADTAAPADA